MSQTPHEGTSLAQLYLLEQGFAQVFRGSILTLLLLSGIITIDRFGFSHWPFYMLGLLPILFGCRRLHFAVRRDGPVAPKHNVLIPACLVACFSPFYYWWSAIPYRLFFLVNILIGLVTVFLLLIQLNRLMWWTGHLLKDRYLRYQTAITVYAVMILQVAPFFALFITAFSSTIRFNSELYPEMRIQLTRFPWWMIGLALLPLVATITNCWYTQVLCREKIQSKLAMQT